jgi:hypothetical protein
MSGRIIHRIYTEDKRRATILRVISEQFESFTMQPTTGYYRGKAGEIHRAGVRGRKGIPGQMAGGAYSRNKSTSVRLGDHFERTQQKDDH